MGIKKDTILTTWKYINKLIINIFQGGPKKKTQVLKRNKISIFIGLYGIYCGWISHKMTLVNEPSWGGHLVYLPSKSVEDGRNPSI